MMMHTAALCCVGPFSVGVAKHVLFSFLFSLLAHRKARSDDTWANGRGGGKGTEHNMVKMERGHSGNDDKRVCMSTHLRRRIDYEGIS